MENASKALLMAGGILISLIIIGVLLLMFNQLGAFQKAQSSSEKDAQLAIFNQEFAKYADETSLKGIDIISLANKVVDFNQKSGITNSVDYDQKITLSINMNNFVTIHGKNLGNKNDCLFSKDKYEVTSNNIDNNPFYKVIDYYSDLETRYGLKTLQLLTSNYYNISNGQTIANVIGKDVYDKNGEKLTIENVAEYKEYSEFKTSTFNISSGYPEYKNGQIIKLSFEFVK